MFIYIDFLIKKILKRKQNVIMVFICFFVIVFIYVMNINSQKILRDSLASQIKMSEKAINDKTKIMESNDVDDSSIQSEYSTHLEPHRPALRATHSII